LKPANGDEQFVNPVVVAGGLLTATVVLAVPSMKPYLAAMLLAALVIWLLVVEVLVASSAAAVAAAVSAAPCIVRFVRYQLAASVPSPAKPMITDRASASMTAVEPAGSPSKSLMSRDARREIERVWCIRALLRVHVQAAQFTDGGGA
jgi:hypothetical protein